MNGSEQASVDQVDYGVLDRAKQSFISASRRTLEFASPFGQVINSGLGASANIFALKSADGSSPHGMHMTMLPEGLGTADDARPDDLTDDELKWFWQNIGVKTLACLTNDAASGGCRPLLIGLYLPSSTPEEVFSEPFLTGFLDGVVESCRKIGCVYLSGETPQLRGKIVPGKLDIAGCTWGVMPANYAEFLQCSPRVSDGAVIVLVASSGPHENGFTPLRAFATKLEHGYRTALPSGVQYWEAINAPSILYSPLVMEVLKDGVMPLSMECISGHGWLKLMRSREKLCYTIRDVLPVPEVFSFIQERFEVSTKEMLTTFNYGAGFAFFLRNEADAARVVGLAQRLGYNAKISGSVHAAERRELVVEPFGVRIDGDSFLLQK